MRFFLRASAPRTTLFPRSVVDYNGAMKPVSSRCALVVQIGWLLASSTACGRVSFDVAQDAAVADTGQDIDSSTRDCVDEGALSCGEGGIVRCTAGVQVLDTPCVHRCVDDPEPGCRLYLPSNVDDRIPIDESTEPLVLDSAGGSPSLRFFTFQTLTGRIDQSFSNGTASALIRQGGQGLVDGIGFHLLVTPGAVENTTAVFTMGSLELAAADTILVRGPHPAVFLVAADATIRGQVIVSGGWFGAFEPGPGGFGPGTGPGAGAPGSMPGTPLSGGGGGAGYGGVGGAGSTPAGVPVGGAAGSTYGNPSLIPLLGGSGGGQGHNLVGHGGTGGGALQISAGGALVVTGSINAGGGVGPRPGTTTDVGGPGGGSGGAILLEGTTVTVSGFLGANGATGSTGSIGGVAGRTDVVPVVFTMPINTAGRGSDETGVAGAANAPAAGEGGYGGGGGGGRIRINSALGTESCPVGATPNEGAGLCTVGTVQNSQ